MTKMKGTEGNDEHSRSGRPGIVFLGERATGATSLLQCVWTYDRAIDIDGLRRFHHHLLRRPAVPSRRTVTVAVRPPSVGDRRNDAPAIEIAPSPRPREEFGAWLRRADRHAAGLSSTDPHGISRCFRSPTAAPV